MHMVWNISPIIGTLGPLTLRWYGLLFGLGFILAAGIMNKIFIREKQNAEALDSLVGFMVLGTIVGARLGHTLIYEPEVYLADPIRILYVWEGGLASHGGALGALLAAWWWNRKHGEGRTYLQFLDLICVPTALVTSFIRLANFFNSEIIGRPTDSFLGVIFSRVDQLPRHPAMLYECFVYLANYFFLTNLLNAHKNRRPGYLFGMFLTVLFVARFLIEFVKEVQVQAENGMMLDYGQLLSIPFIGLGIFLIVRANRNPEVELPVSAHVTPKPQASSGSGKKRKR
ncbi:MAG: prolipoprotein diacylglyceryl transferase [Bdellovibrionales bacterium]|nr:prolipoprotein diacylglyceryl transferase [Bdellovibrionales bacterium]